MRRICSQFTPIVGLMLAFAAWGGEAHAQSCGSSVQSFGS